MSRRQGVVHLLHMARPSISASDAALLRAARHDAECFAELYGRYEGVLTAYLARQTRDAHLTADLVAETFATMVLHADGYRDDGAGAGGWLLRIARNLFLQHLRRGRAEQRARDRLGIATITLDQSSIDRVEELMDLSAASPRLHDLLNRLPEDQRAAIEGRVLEELDYAELAEKLQVPQSTLRQRVSRGLARMRTTLEGADR